MAAIGSIKINRFVKELTLHLREHTVRLDVAPPQVWIRRQRLSRLMGFLSFSREHDCPEGLELLIDLRLPREIDLYARLLHLPYEPPVLHPGIATPLQRSCRRLAG